MEKRIFFDCVHYSLECNAECAINVCIVFCIIELSLRVQKKKSSCVSTWGWSAVDDGSGVEVATSQ